MAGYLSFFCSCALNTTPKQELAHPQDVQRQVCMNRTRLPPDKFRKFRPSSRSLIRIRRNGGSHTNHLTRRTTPMLTDWRTTKRSALLVANNY